MLRIDGVLRKRAVKADKMDRLLAAVEPNGNALQPHEVEGHIVLEDGAAPSLADMTAASWRRIGRLEDKVERQGLQAAERWTETKLVATAAKKAAEEAQRHAIKAHTSAQKAAAELVAVQKHLSAQDDAIAKLRSD